MSAKSDALKVVSRAEKQGCEVIKGKHGGYGLYMDGRLITRVPSNGNAAPSWLRRVRRDLAPYGVIV